MPHPRKRKATENICSETQKKSRKDCLISSVHSKIKKEKLDAADDKLRIPSLKTNVKQKKDNSNNTRNQLQNEHVKNKIKNETTVLSQEPRHQKSKVLSNTIDIKKEEHDFAESGQPMDSKGSGILSETFEEGTMSDKVKNIEVSNQSPIKIDVMGKSKDSSSESEWEEVEENCEINLDDYKPDIPKEGIEITIDCPDLNVHKRTKKKFDENTWIRLHINRVRKDIQLSMHKTHLLCLLAHGIYVNKLLNSDVLKAFALSLIPNDVTIASSKKIDKLDESGIENIVSFFHNIFTFKAEKDIFVNLFQSLKSSFQNKRSMNTSEYNLMFVIVARTLGLKVRFCISLYPMSYKASNLIKKQSSVKQNSNPSEQDKIRNENSVGCSKETKMATVKKQLKPKRRKVECLNSEIKDKSKINRPRRSKSKSYKLSSEEEDNVGEDYIIDIDSEDDKPKKKPLKQKSISKRKSNRKILSSDSDLEPPQESPDFQLEPNSVVCWAEVFSKPNKQWISVECVNNIINKPYDIEVLLPKPVSYILAIDNESYVKDVTKRYCNEYLTSTLKLRADTDWWDETLEPFLPPNSKQNRDEEKKLEEMLLNKPLPTTVQGFKNHPLYALKRHLLKFEAIYPPDAPPVGFLRGEPVYARDCVHQLHSRETWLKEARVVRIGEQPYKVVKSRPKWDRIAGILRTDLPLEIFGLWQTEPYEPPIAVGGKVPRNEYGNVELFKTCMLPRGTVHLQLPGLNRVAKKLNIDCSPAVVGFDGHKGSIHPVFDGFVICEEFKDVIIAAWVEEQENIKKREEEKREKRIYGNWRKLIKGLLIRERIKLKYDTK